MSIVHFAATSVVSFSAGIVVLTGEASSQFNFNNLTYSGFSFESDGSIDEIGPAFATRSQIDLGEWWSEEPDGSIGTLYDIRCASLVTGTWDAQAATVGTWVQLNIDRLWYEFVTAMNAPDDQACTGVFEIRDTGSGSALDSANYSAAASN